MSPKLWASMGPRKGTTVDAKGVGSNMGITK